MYLPLVRDVERGQMSVVFVSMLNISVSSYASVGVVFSASTESYSALYLPYVVVGVR